VTCRFDSDEDTTTTGLRIPTQAQAIVEGPGSLAVSELQRVPDVDYIQELLAIQQQGPRTIGFFGTRNMGFMHQELIQILSYAMVITVRHFAYKATISEPYVWFTTSYNHLPCDLSCRKTISTHQVQLEPMQLL